ncbi:Uncharacterised protein [Cedecea neteri]|uniref:Uncharacterized protein n=1 Tax=Cedecea neteri TaxID=158822 RepID=A0A2X3J9B6_9ENTR|nr:Uncharacterised protein [Cedecea neteri]
MLADLCLEQEAAFGNVVPLEDVRQLLLCIVRIEVSQETQVATVDADNFDVIASEHPSGAQHITISADHHGQISLLTYLRQRAGLHLFEVQLLGDLLFHHHFIAFGAQPAIEHFMRGQSGGVTRMADDTDAVEMFVHYPGGPYSQTFL